jgi:pimeloyl-ACP methyl ester carboxylesterase
LSGQGESVLGAGDVSVDLWARQIRSVIFALNYDQANVLAIGAAAAIATEFALAFPELVNRIVFQSPPTFPAAMRSELIERYPVEAKPAWDGSHLTRVWHHMRDQELWWPWFDKRAATARTHKLATDTWLLTRRVRESLKQPDNYAAVWQAILRYPLLEKMSLIECKANVASVGGDLFERYVDGACRALNEKKPIGLPEGIAARATALDSMYTEPGD